MRDYHAVLCTLFHQVSSGSGSFALAASQLDLHYWDAKDYLLHHAEEEKTHWQWILNDLRETGFAAPTPDQELPSAACEAYIAYNYYVAQRRPLGRLAIAAVLEGIGATYSKAYAMKVTRLLNLRPAQLQFFLGHGDTDVGHVKDIFDVLRRTPLSEKEWDVMTHTANTGFVLYQAMYEEAAQMSRPAR
jgi:heme oxygenase